WMQIANFIVCGVLVICFAFGLRRVLSPGRASLWGPLLLGIFGLCLICAGIFVTDPFLGYPPDAPITATLHGSLHLFVSLIVFISLPAACFVMIRRFVNRPAWRGWVLYSLATGILVLLFFVLTDVIANLGLQAPAGLFQRITISIGWIWVAVLAFRLLTIQQEQAL
ncbi:MAG TPA: DUF998 domain-containing protein, partial [Ktedonobacteraceae bacterium]|nr:DUF998 domain-containing protein [Ktedonobacteraceae bacterium]